MTKIPEGGAPRVPNTDFDPNRRQEKNHEVRLEFDLNNQPKTQESLTGDTIDISNENVNPQIAKLAEDIRILKERFAADPTDRHIQTAIKYLEGKLSELRSVEQ